jgi:SAM-dependent methyltransferase
MSNLLRLPGRLVRSAIDVNVKLSQGMESKFSLPTDKTLWQSFDDQADELLRSLPDEAIVLDLGGGRRFFFSKSVQPAERLRVIAVDISAEELALNEDVRETCVADVSKGLPLPAASVDLILSRALLEHVNGVPAAIEHMGEVLKPGGIALHMVPCRYSLFGMAARFLPFGPLLWLTHVVMPHTRGFVEFPVVYDHCYPQALESAFKKAGFRDVRCEITWACPGYFESVFPLFVFHAAWEWAARRLGIKRLAAYTIVSATR